jgi:hypothetical protein
MSFFRVLAPRPLSLGSSAGSMILKAVNGKNRQLPDRQCTSTIRSVRGGRGRNQTLIYHHRQWFSEPNLDNHSWSPEMANDRKKQRIVVRCLCDILALFRQFWKPVQAQKRRDLWVIGRRWEHLITLPPAKRYRANLQSTSSFRLKDLQLEAPSSQMSADGGRFLWHWNTTVTGW